MQKEAQATYGKGLYLILSKQHPTLFGTVFILCTGIYPINKGRRRYKKGFHIVKNNSCLLNVR